MPSAKERLLSSGLEVPEYGMEEHVLVVLPMVVLTGMGMLVIAGVLMGRVVVVVVVPAPVLARLMGEFGGALDDGDEPQPPAAVTVLRFWANTVELKKVMAMKAAERAIWICFWVVVEEDYLRKQTAKRMC